MVINNASKRNIQLLENGFLKKEMMKKFMVILFMLTQLEGEARVKGGNKTS